jgi:hypothetical protein
MIGRRGIGNFQFFPGLLTGIRITNTLVYTDTFDPYTIALPPAKVTGTKLLLNPTNYTTLDDLSDSNHGWAGGIGNNSDYPPQLLVMDLDPMNYTSGSSISDASGKNNNGTLVGSPTFTTGGTNGSGNYFTLDGTSQYITVPSLLTSAYTSVTMSLWFNSSTGVGSLITKELSYKMRLNAGGSLAVLASSTGTGWQYNSTNVLDIASNDAWHHFAVSIGPDFVDWYLDGTRIQHEAGMGVDIHTSTRGVQIGGYDSNVPSELFTGKIGPARLYNYALTSSAVSTYYNATKSRYQPVAITHTALQSADNNGSNGVHLDTVTYDAWVSSVPVGATIVADTNPFVTTTVTSIHTPTEPGNFSANWWFEISPSTANFPSGTTFTISWTA